MNLIVSCRTDGSWQPEADCFHLCMTPLLPADRCLIPIASNVPRTKILRLQLSILTMRAGRQFRNADFILIARRAIPSPLNPLNLLNPLNPHAPKGDTTLGAAGAVKPKNLFHNPFTQPACASRPQPAAKPRPSAPFAPSEPGPLCSPHSQSSRDRRVISYKEGL